MQMFSEAGARLSKLNSQSVGTFGNPTIQYDCIGMDKQYISYGCDQPRTKLLVSPRKLHPIRLSAMHPLFHVRPVRPLRRDSACRWHANVTK